MSLPTADDTVNPTPTLVPERLGTGPPGRRSAEPRTRRRAGRRFGVRVLAVLALLALWQVAATAARNPSFIPRQARSGTNSSGCPRPTTASAATAASLLVEHLG